MAGSWRTVVRSGQTRIALITCVVLSGLLFGAAPSGFAVQAQDTTATNSATATPQDDPVAAFLAQPLSAEEQARVDWLVKNAVPVAIDPANDDFSDLQPLKAMIGERRIVQLGEQSHGDGTTFLAKIRLIKFLHQEMGFDVIAFESGLYDCRQAWAAFQAGEPPLDAASQGIFSIWTGSQQVQPLIEYLGAQAKTDHPLELAGVDCQFTASASQQSLAQDIAAICDKLGDARVSAETRAGLAACLQAMMTPGQDYAQDKEASAAHAKSLATFAETLNTAEPTEQLPADELAFWRQYAKSLIAYQAYSAEATNPPDAKLINARDAQMADNLVWLARERYPNRKIIVWAASFHLIRNPETITFPSSPELYKGLSTMGHGAYPALGEETFTLGFTALEGKIGRAGAQPRNLPLPPAHSLEHLFAKAGEQNAALENALIGFTQLDESGAWLKEQLTARPLGYAPMTADWTQVLDGLLYTRVMVPSDRRAENN